ncbi:MAG: hypothetical protein ICV69_12265 [Thermoleophilaceae bacterium]|nr:hypothetical protein [Thermoleophilaceae bacterium]
MSMRTIPLVAVAAATLTLSMPAVAKEIEAASVCGADGCRKVDVDRGNHALVEGGPIGAPPRTPSPFYRVRLAVGDGSGRIVDRFATIYVPSVRKLRGSDGTWMDARPRTVRALRRVTRGREPFRARALEAAMLERTGGTSLAPEVVRPPEAARGGGGAAWLVAIGAGGGLALLTGVVGPLRRRMGRGRRDAS